MALSKSMEIAAQFVVAKARIEGYIVSQVEHHGIQLILGQIALASQFEVLLVLRGKDDGSHCTAFR